MRITNFDVLRDILDPSKLLISHLKRNVKHLSTSNRRKGKIIVKLFHKYISPSSESYLKLFLWDKVSDGKRNSANVF